MARPFRTKQPTKTPRVSAEDAEHIVPVDDGTPKQRLHKLLATAGLGSRRDMENLIETGRVTINGQLASVGAAVSEHDIVRVDSRPVRLSFEPELPQVLLYHKPEGEIVSQDDPEKRATVFDKLPRVKGAKWIAIGRLDINTSGLLIFTTSGELANRFMHPRYEVEREYAVRILGELSDEHISQLTQGIELEDGPANFDSIYSEGGEGVNHWYKVILREGRNREVRRLFEALHMPVSRLMRVRFGPINLPPRLKRAQMLKLLPKEVIGLLEWAELPVPRAPLKQLNQREKDKLGTAYTPKTRKTAAEREQLASDGAPKRNSRKRQEGYQPDARKVDKYQPERSKAEREAAQALRKQNARRGESTESVEEKRPVGTKRPMTPKKPAASRKPAQNRRVRQTSDLTPPQQQKKSDRNRGRG